MATKKHQEKEAAELTANKRRRTRLAKQTVPQPVTPEKANFKQLSKQVKGQTKKARKHVALEVLKVLETLAVMEDVTVEKMDCNDTSDIGTALTQDTAATMDLTNASSEDDTSEDDNDDTAGCEQCTKRESHISISPGSSKHIIILFGFKT